MLKEYTVYYNLQTIAVQPAKAHVRVRVLGEGEKLEARIAEQQMGAVDVR